MDVVMEGLSSEEAARRLAETGPNEVPAARESRAARLAGKFWAPVPWMLEATAILEILTGKWLDAVFVALVLVLNAVIGLVQEGRAQSALDLLRSRLEVTARVMRDGAWSTLPAGRLVPGDVVHVRMGDFVPADARVLEGEILADESGLTGESIPAERSPGSDLHSGTVVVRGEATARVTATGPRTVFGRTAQLVGTSAPAEHLGAVVLRMVRVFILLDLVIAAAGTVVLALSGGGFDTVLSFAVVLLLASVPVALPAAFALAGALGARRLADDGILTTRLSVLQEAASMSVLCVDKTGTLTTNRLSLAAVAADDGGREAEVLRLAGAASEASTQDPIDLAILTRSGPVEEDGWTRTAFVPFDPATKRSEAAWSTPAGTLAVTKGAPAVIAALTGTGPGAALSELAATGARVLAVASRRTDTDAGGTGRWHHEGLVALADTVREDASALLGRLGALGVRPIMVTGDSAQTAAAVAAQLGLAGRVATADALDSEPADLAGVAAVAQVLPEHKHRIVQRLQSQGHVVGMTGDGVNDAPALRQAEVGVAVEGATDVAKAAAGAVLTRGGLVDLVALIEESRRIHQRSLTYALNVSVKKIEVPALLALGVFAWQQFVFTPLLMALLLVANDVVSMAVTVDRAHPSGRPDVWRIGRVITGALAVALPMLAVSAVILAATRFWLGLDLEAQRTAIFVTLVLSSQATIYLVRTGRPVWRSRPSRWLAVASAIDLVAALGLALLGWLMHPLAPAVLLGIVAAVLLGAVAADTVKVVVFRRLGLHTASTPAGS
jgi:H+-transporting ATPase